MLITNLEPAGNDRVSALKARLKGLDMFQALEKNYGGYPLYYGLCYWLGLDLKHYTNPNELDSSALLNAILESTRDEQKLVEFLDAAPRKSWCNQADEDYRIFFSQLEKLAKLGFAAGYYDELTEESRERATKINNAETTLQIRKYLNKDIISVISVLSDMHAALEPPEESKNIWELPVVRQKLTQLTPHEMEGFLSGHMQQLHNAEEVIRDFTNLSFTLASEEAPLQSQVYRRSEEDPNVLHLLPNRVAPNSTARKYSGLFHEVFADGEFYPDQNKIEDIAVKLRTYCDRLGALRLDTEILRKIPGLGPAGYYKPPSQVWVKKVKDSGSSRIHANADTVQTYLVRSQLQDVQDVLCPLEDVLNPNLTKGRGR